MRHWSMPKMAKNLGHFAALGHEPVLKGPAQRLLTGAVGADTL